MGSRLQSKTLACMQERSAVAGTVTIESRPAAHRLCRDSIGDNMTTNKINCWSLTIIGGTRQLKTLLGVQADMEVVGSRR